MYNFIFNLGNGIDRLLLYVAIISAVLGVIGLITGAVWTTTAWLTVMYAGLFSFVWFAFTLFYLMSKVKQERSANMQKEIEKTFSKETINKFNVKMKTHLGATPHE